jgi:hypothetical protein
VSTIRYRECGVGRARKRTNRGMRRFDASLKGTVRVLVLPSASVIKVKTVWLHLRVKNG